MQRRQPGPGDYGLLVMLAMIWGVLVGTYSTVYIATPVLVYLDLRSNAGTADGADKTTPGKPAPRPTGGG